MSISGRIKCLGAVALAAFTASCSQLDSRQNVGPCPVAGVLFDASRVVNIEGEDRHENVGWTGSIEGVKGFCRYVGTNPITMEIDIDFAFGKGPKAEGDRHSYPYFVTVTRRNQIVLAKRGFTADVRFKPGEDVVRVRDTVSGIVIPRAKQDISGTNFEILVGFDLTPEQLAYNRSGKRFLMDVDK
ncbi:MAG: hypothetical protein R3C52_02810 [Hyphomonadaceae bacterium]